MHGREFSDHDFLLKKLLIDPLELAALHQHSLLRVPHFHGWLLAIA